MNKRSLHIRIYQREQTELHVSPTSDTNFGYFYDRDVKDKDLLEFWRELRRSFHYLKRTRFDRKEKQARAYLTFQQRMRLMPVPDRYRRWFSLVDRFIDDNIN